MKDQVDKAMIGPTYRTDGFSIKYDHKSKLAVRSKSDNNDHGRVHFMFFKYTSFLSPISSNKKHKKNLHGSRPIAATVRALIFNVTRLKDIAINTKMM